MIPIEKLRQLSTEELDKLYIEWSKGCQCETRYKQLEALEMCRRITVVLSERLADQA